MKNELQENINDLITEADKCIAEKIIEKTNAEFLKKLITQDGIVRRPGVSRSSISNIENGKTNTTISTITNIAKALGVSSDELLK